jgi:hypothetical protein
MKLFASQYQALIEGVESKGSSVTLRCEKDEIMVQIEVLKKLQTIHPEFSFAFTTYIPATTIIPEQHGLSPRNPSVRPVHSA